MAGQKLFFFFLFYMLHYLFCFKQNDRGISKYVDITQISPRKDPNLFENVEGISSVLTDVFIPKLYEDVNVYSRFISLGIP